MATQTASILFRGAHRVHGGVASGRSISLFEDDRPVWMFREQVRENEVRLTSDAVVTDPTAFAPLVTSVLQLAFAIRGIPSRTRSQRLLRRIRKRVDGNLHLRTSQD